MDLQREITVLTRRLNSQIMQRAGCSPLTTSIRLLAQSCSKDWDTDSGRLELWASGGFVGNAALSRDANRKR